MILPLAGVDPYEAVKQTWTGKLMGSLGFEHVKDVDIGTSVVHARFYKEDSLPQNSHTGFRLM